MKSKYDTATKVRVFNSQYWRVIKDYRSSLIEKDKEYGALDFLYWCKHYRHIDKDLDCLLLMKDSRKRKVKRLRKKIESLVLEHNAVFVTLTFTDEVLSTTTQETRRRYVARFLKDNCSCYVANIDFSPDKDREHYHAVVSSDIDFTWWSEHCGFVYAERVRNYKNQNERISRYITKLTSHALKCDRQKIIYSRQ